MTKFRTLQYKQEGPASPNILLNSQTSLPFPTEKNLLCQFSNFVVFQQFARHWGDVAIIKQISPVLKEVTV